MTATTMQGFVSTHRSGLAMSVVGHVLMLVTMSSSILFMPSTPMPRLAIEAVIVDSSAIRKAAVQERQQNVAEDQRRKDEQARQAQEQQKQQAADQRQQQQVRAEQERKQAEAKAKTESERKALLKREADVRAKAEQQRKKAEADAKAAAERAAAAAKAQAQSRRQAELIASMEAEEALVAAAQSGEMDRYAALIQQQVERKWVRPGSARAGLECVVVVQQLPSGDVIDVRTESCNGDETVRRSIETAVRRASPLPRPDNMALFDRNLRFTFKPEQ